MPRAKFDRNNPYNLQFYMVGAFKVNYSDILCDFKHIYTDLIQYHKDYDAELTNTLKDKLNVLKTLKLKPAFKNRVYIVVNGDCPVLAMMDVDEAVFNNLIDKLDILNEIAPSAPMMYLSTYLSTIHFFNQDLLQRFFSISPFQLAQFMAVFKNENICDYQGHRDGWYGEPRRKYKKSLQSEK